MRALALRLFEDDRGQDLIEYALLMTVIGLSSIAVFDLIRTAIAVTYGSWNTSANSLWRPPSPAP